MHSISDVSVEVHNTYSLHTLSTRLLAADTYVPAPLPAAARIAHHPFRSQLKTQWNTQIESLFRGVQGIDVRVAEWGRKVFYGGDASREGSS